MQPMQPNNDLANNLQMRQVLLATAIRGSKKLGTFTETAEGSTTRIKLFNVGVVTKLRMLVTINVDIGTATATLSPKAPFNSIKQLRLTDYEGTDRVNLTGYQLWQINSVRKRAPAFINNEGLADVSALPSTPVGVGAGQDIQFYMEVPLAFNDENDLRGAILAQTALGEMFLNVTWNDDFHQNGNDDGVYNGAGTSTVAVNSISVDVYQDYLMPQVIGDQTPLPLVDLITVYELNGNLKVTDNLSNGQQRLISYPNVRNVIGAYVNWQNNGILSNSISEFKLIANGNNILRENGLQTQLMDQRGWIHGDLKTGGFFMQHRARPIETSQFGNVQWGLTLNAAPTGDFYLEQAFESMFAKGSTLPGIEQG